MAQTQNTIPVKSTGGTVTAAEFNELTALTPIDINSSFDACETVWTLTGSTQGTTFPTMSKAFYATGNSVVDNFPCLFLRKA